MKEWNDDKELVSLIKGELYTAVVGDIMDKMGYTHQFLPPHIRPLRDDMFVAGRAMTVLEADVYDNQGTSGTNPVLKRSFGLMLEALDDLKEGEIYICSGSSPSYALWGELMSARAMQCKAAGAVVNGYSRDTKGILALNFPCFSYGPYAQDQAPRGKVLRGSGGRDLPRNNIYVAYRCRNCKLADNGAESPSAGRTPQGEALSAGGRGGKYGEKLVPGEYVARDTHAYKCDTRNERDDTPRGEGSCDTRLRREHTGVGKLAAVDSQRRARYFKNRVRQA